MKNIGQSFRCIYTTLTHHFSFRPTSGGWGRVEYPLIYTLYVVQSLQPIHYMQYPQAAVVLWVIHILYIGLVSSTNGIVGMGDRDGVKCILHKDHTNPILDKAILTNTIIIFHTVDILHTTPITYTTSINHTSLILFAAAHFDTIHTITITASCPVK